jgi:hypothetical protein
MAYAIKAIRILNLSWRSKYRNSKDKHLTFRWVRRIRCCCSILHKKRSISLTNGLIWHRQTVYMWLKWKRTQEPIRPSGCQRSDQCQNHGETSISWILKKKTCLILGGLPEYDRCLIIHSLTVWHVTLQMKNIFKMTDTKTCCKRKP